jgi:hypothetical protein
MSLSVSDIMSIRDIIGICIGAASIALLVRNLNRRDDPLQAEFPGDDSDDWPEDQPPDLHQSRRIG